MKNEFTIEFYADTEETHDLTDFATCDVYELTGYYDGEQFEVYRNSSTIKVDGVPRSLTKLEYRMFNEFISDEIISILEEEKRQAELDRIIGG